MKKLIFASTTIVLLLAVFNNCAGSFEAQKATDNQNQSSTQFPNPNPVMQPSPQPAPAPAPMPLPTPTLQNWIPTNLNGAPVAALMPSSVSTGTKMITFGGYLQNNLVWTNAGGILDPITNTWTATRTVGAPAPRYAHSAVWTGSRMIIWGGMTVDGGGQPVPMNSGGIYDPVTDTWTVMSTVGAPSPRYYHSAIWTGSKMIVWGGNIAILTVTQDGAAYDPATNTWSPISAVGAATGRTLHSAVYAGGKMIVFGGAVMSNTNPTTVPTPGGGIYDPTTNTWSAMILTNAPTARINQVAVSTGTKMIVHGGNGPTFAAVRDGAIFDPATNTWTPMNQNSSPSERGNHTAVWTGSKMVVFGGMGNSTTNALLNDGGIFDPATNSWAPIPMTVAPIPRDRHNAVWCTDRMIVFGGNVVNTGSQVTNTGGILY